jgi:DNA-directed RNA polymerase omega subunit
MLLFPPIEQLIAKVGNPYKLAVLVSKRAKLLQQSLTEQEKEEKKEVTRAVEEVYNGKII